jgi:hypothetical protein
MLNEELHNLYIHLLIGHSADDEIKKIGAKTLGIFGHIRLTSTTSRGKRNLFFLGKSLLFTEYRPTEKSA